MLEVVTLVEAPAWVVLDLALDVDAHTSSVPGQETATTSTGRRILGLGDEVTFEARHFGLPWRMTSRITSYDRPGRFVDEQTSGPFRSLRHEHVFRDLGGSRTEMVDRMHVRAPLWPLSVPLTRTVLEPHLRRLLVQRAAYLKQRAEGGAA